jgi:hypothetical protein
MCECTDIIKQYIQNTEKVRNFALQRNQPLLVIWYQSMLDILCQVCEDLEHEQKQNNKEDVT